MLQALADHGATPCEPGHGLTGTTPLHALRDLPDGPAAVYVGGGLYIDPVFASRVPRRGPRIGIRRTADTTRNEIVSMITGLA